MDAPATEPRLTQFSHGAGCGCKISPRVLDEILASNLTAPGTARLLVGNDAKDDAAAYDLGDGTALLSTTDFFMPIVDDAFDFGRIASANAISDVYAMGGRPILALGILGWPIDKLPASVARRVLEGARHLCAEAGVMLAGGHSIDSPEPIFGLAVNGITPIANLKRNSGALPGDQLYLTKPLGAGILTTAEKKGLLRAEDRGLAARNMLKLNSAGLRFGELTGVHALTDVTGFGLLGHLAEVCAASGVSAELEFAAVPQLTDLEYYLEKNSVPGGTGRNFDSYGAKVGPLDSLQRNILCDPQTSGGLLVSVGPEAAGEFEQVLAELNLAEFARPIGSVAGPRTDGLLISVR